MYAQAMVCANILEHFHIGQSESQAYLLPAFIVTKCGRLPDLLSTNLAFTVPGEGQIELVPCTSF